MGRLSALILQAVCLAGCLTERQADAYVIAANRQEDREAASAGQSSFCKLSGPLTLFLFLPLLPVLAKSIKVIGGERADISQVGGVVDHLPRQRATRYLFLSLEHDWWKEGTTSSGSVTTRNNPYSVIQWCGGGWLPFPSPVTPERHPAALPWQQLWTCLPPWVQGQGWVTSRFSVFFAPVGGAGWLWHSRMCVGACLWKCMRVCICRGAHIRLSS